MSWPIARYKTFAPGGSHLPADSNGMQDLTLNATGFHLDGKTNIAATESRTNVAYGLMTTPDRVQNVVLPTDGFIAVMFQATWQESVANAAKAAIFIGANQAKIAPSSLAGATAPAVQEVGMVAGAAAAEDAALATTSAGLTTTSTFNAGNYSGDVTTGQIVGVGSSGGFVSVFAAAGTYDISVQFKSSSGSVTVKNRKLWIWTAT